MIDLNQYVEQELKKINLNEFFQEILKQQLRVTIEKCLKDALGSYSTFSREFEKIIEKELKFNPDRLSLPVYSEFVVEQATEVIQSLMDEQRAANIRQKFVQKIAPNLEKEISFDSLIDEIRVAIGDSYEEHDCDPPIFHIVCEEEERKYSDGPYYQLTISEGEEPEKWSQAIAQLNLFPDGRAYHACGGRENHPFFRRFKSYAFNATIVTGLYEMNQKLTYEDYM